MSDERLGVAVVGSLNLDLSVRVRRLPEPGQTVLGGDLVMTPGGKGANQAAAAARLGQRVAMVGCVGDDDAGRELVSQLQADGVDTAAVAVLRDGPTGSAVVWVDGEGENAIVVSPGANARLTPEHVQTPPAVSALQDAAVTLISLEVPLETATAAARAARGMVVLNPAPAAPLPPALLAEVDILVPNRSELRDLLGGDAPDGPTEVAELAALIGGPRAVVVTMGADGAMICAAGRAKHVPAVGVPAVVDTTAAGDSFCGALADALARGGSVEAAVKWAVRAAAVTVTRPGAQASLPRRAEVVATA